MQPITVLTAAILKNISPIGVIPINEKPKIVTSKGCGSRSEPKSRIEPPSGAHRKATDSALEAIVRRLDDEVHMVSLDRIVDNPERIALGVPNAILDFIVQWRKAQVGQVCGPAQRDMHRYARTMFRPLDMGNILSAHVCRTACIGPKTAASKRLCAIERELTFGRRAPPDSGSYVRPPSLRE